MGVGWSLLVCALVLNLAGCRSKEGAVHQAARLTPEGLFSVSCSRRPLSPRLRIHPDQNPGESHLIHPDEIHDFQIPLHSGELLKLSADQSQADLVLCFYNPSGILQLAVDSPNGREEPEELLWLAKSPGTFQLQVSSLEKQAGTYRVTVQVLRQASDPDRDHLTAILAGATAEALRRSKNPKGWHEAQNEYINALEIWRRLGDQRREGDLLARLGRLQRERLADMHTAYATYRRAHALLAPLGEKRRDLRTLVALAEITSELDRYEEALGLQREVLRIARQLNDLEAQAVALNQIGNLEDLAGESLEAMTSYSQALEIWSQLADSRGSSMTLRSRAQIYDSLGKYHEALDDWERARALSPGKPSDQAAILTSMANTHIRLGQPSEALDLLEQALALRKAIADRRGEAITETGLGFAYHRLGRLPEAASHLDYALRLFQKFGSPGDRVRALYDYGLALKDLGRLSEAAPLLAAAIEDGTQFGDAELVEAALVGLAQIRRTQGDLITALKLSQKAIESIENARARPWSPNLRAAFFATKQNSYDFTHCCPRTPGLIGEEGLTGAFGRV